MKLISALTQIRGEKKHDHERMFFKIRLVCIPDPTESTPSVMDSFQSGEVQVGRSVELPCIASGFPNPTIRWLKDGRPLPADSRWTRRLTGLTISDLRMEDSGNYICEVTNSFGSKEVTGYLNVIGEGMNTGKVEKDFHTVAYYKCLFNLKKIVNSIIV